MENLKRLDPLWIILLIVGGLNWAILALFDTNVVAEVFGAGTGADIVYVVVGLAALMLMPRLFDDMHLTHRHTHARGV